MTTSKIEQETVAFFKSEIGKNLIKTIDDLNRGVKALEDVLKNVPAISEHLDIEGQKKKRKRAEKDPNAPKGPLSSYMLFTKDQRALMKESDPEFEPKALVSEIGRRWREADEEIKEKYRELAAEEKAKYVIVMESYSKPGTEKSAVLIEDSQESQTSEVENSDSDSDSTSEELDAPVVPAPVAKKAKTGKPKKEVVVKTEPIQKAAVPIAKPVTKPAATPIKTPVTKEATVPVKAPTPNTTEKKKKKKKAVVVTDGAATTGTTTEVKEKKPKVKKELSSA